MNRRNLLLAPVLAVCLLLSGCASLLQNFRMGISAAKPFVGSLVTSGLISQSIATDVTADLDDGINTALTGEQCLKSISATGAEKNVAKGKCYFTVSQGLRSILNRHHIGGVKALDQLAEIIQGAINAFEQYYATVNPSKAVRGAANSDTATPAGDPDKTLEDTLKRRMEELKKLTKG